MKVIQRVIAGIIFSAFAANVSAADKQKGIKMLIDAASGHHRSPSGPASSVGTDDKQSGIKTLIEAATASRHPRSLSGHAAKDAGSRGEWDKEVGGKSDGDEYMDRTLRDLNSAAVTAKESAALGRPATSRSSGASVSGTNAGIGADTATRSAAAQPQLGPSPTAMNGAATGGDTATVSGVNAGAATSGARTRAIAVGLSNARRNRIALQDSSAVTGVPSLPSRGTLNGTGMGRPAPAIGGAAITTNAGRLNGTTFRSKH
jgi:hypothetical protein